MPDGYQVIFQPNVRRDVKSIPKEDLQRILKRTEALANDPRPPGSIKVADPDSSRLSRSSRASAREAEPMDYLERLRLFWLSSDQSTKELAAALEISPPHLIRLLRGDRRPSRKLRQRIAALAPRVSS